MIDLERSSDVFTVRGADLAISFRHIGDRWQHRVSAREGGAWLRLLASEEGSAEAATLPSPVFQDLRCEELPGGAVEFQLLGQAGGAVYSAAVRFDHDPLTIDFDVCLRSRAVPSRHSARSQYVLADRGIAVRPQSGSLIVSRGRVAIEVAPVTIPANPPGECRLVIDGAVRRINAGCFEVPEHVACGKGVSVRWRYQMRLLGSP
jgi:hypothetical protein